MSKHPYFGSDKGRPAMSEAIRMHDQGENVRVHQRNLNDRLRAHGNAAIDVDGDCGPQTIAQSAFAAWFLGALDATVATVQGGTITVGVQSMTADPDGRDEAQRERAVERRGTPFPGANGAGPPGRTLTGIDVSNHQPDVDWQQVRAAGHSFAFHKVSEGLGTPDRVFGKARWKAIRDAGLVRGTYHFARPQKGRDPKAEVAEFLRLVDRAGGFSDGDLVPVLDIEAFGQAGKLTPKQTHAWARGFVEEMHARIGRRPIIYTGAFWRDQIGNDPDNLGCRLWLAAFVKDDPTPFVPKAWARESLSIWQHTDTGRCPGIPGNVDLNRLPGGEAALNRLRI
jgi:GH25 family lysozyme M1 (1,4-beta-N-acetylmuramidase)